MLLEELFDYKNQLMKELCSSEPIVRLLTNDPAAPVPCPALAYAQVFPYERVPETADEAKTFICFDVDVVDVENRSFLTTALFLWVFAHKSAMRLPGGGVRTDAIVTETAKLLNGSRHYTMGALELYRVHRFVPVSGGEYQGREIIYRGFDSNRPGTTTANRPTPANRRRP